MTRRTLSIALLAMLVTVTACSSPESSTDPEAAPTQEGSGTGGDKSGGKKAGRHGDGAHKKGSGDKDDSGSGPDGGEADGSEGTDASEGDGLTEGSNEDDDSSAVYPAPGSYTYSQSGYEEFCQAANCEREELPARQPVSITTKQEGSDGATVVMEIRAGSRLVRSTTRFDRTHALVTKVYVRFAYSGFTFEETYSPEPPVESLRFPLTPGESWSGSWRDSTSGDYRIKVFDKEMVSVGGRSVQAFRYETFTDFRGQFNGRSKVTSWIDPATKAIVKTRGVLNVTSTFGRYSTSFATQLRSGPAF